LFYEKNKNEKIKKRSQATARPSPLVRKAHEVDSSLATYIKFYRGFYTSIENYHKNFTAKGLRKHSLSVYERKLRSIITPNILF
jgi:hypothetical protein